MVDMTIVQEYPFYLDSRFVLVILCVGWVMVGWLTGGIAERWWGSRRSLAVMGLVPASVTGAFFGAPLLYCGMLLALAVILLLIFARQSVGDSCNNKTTSL